MKAIITIKTEVEFNNEEELHMISNALARRGTEDLRIERKAKTLDIFVDYVKHFNMINK